MNLEWKNCLRAALTVLFLFVIIHYWDTVFDGIHLVICASVPLLLGAAMAYVVNILMNFYERYFRIICKKSSIHRFRRPICMTLAFLNVFLVAVVLWQMIIPALAACIGTFAETLPQTLDELTLWMQKHSKFCCTFLESVGLMDGGTIDWEGLLKTIVGTLFHNISGTMESLVVFVSAVIKSLITCFLALIFSVYLLLRKERLKEDCRRLLEKCLGGRIMEKAFYVLQVLNTSFHSFIVGQCTEAVILGALCIVGMLVFGFPYATMIGCLVGATALIPLAGAYIGAVVGGLMIFTESPLKALLFILFLAVLQQVEGNIIYPRVVGSTMGLPGLWVLAAVIVGAGVCGICGMLVAVPLTAAAYQLFHEWLAGD